jgi:two-component system, OmpR family, phosphate regulon sensor histidine kinase PhoR
LKKRLLISLLIGLSTAVLMYLLYYILEKQDLLYFPSFYLGVILLSAFLFSFINALIVTWFFVFNPLKKINNQLNDWPDAESDPNQTGNEISDLKKNVERFHHGRLSELNRLNRLETYRKEYVGNVSHELKTPIFNIQGYIETLLDGGVHDPEVNMKFLEKASQSTQRMNQIVDDMQIISQFESDQLVLEKEAFDIIALTKDIGEALDMSVKQKQVTLFIMISKDEKLMVMADKFRIRRVLTNLMVNAINYNKPNGEVRVKFYELDNKIKIEISDNGIGISTEHLPRLFERFYRVDKHRSRENGGSGLGLSIVKHIIEAHDQNIEVMSTPGSGSVFSFCLAKA